MQVAEFRFFLVKLGSSIFQTPDVIEKNLIKYLNSAQKIHWHLIIEISEEKCDYQLYLLPSAADCTLVWK